MPETNKFGLVLPPTTEDLQLLKTPRRLRRQPDFTDRHHLYWPKRLYHTSNLAMNFREHQFNSVWLLRTDHDALHQAYDGVPMPKRDVMQTYLEEASLLDELGVCVRAIEMIDAAIYEGRVRQLQAAEENRLQKLETINSTLKMVSSFEVVSPQIAQLVFRQLDLLQTA